MKFCLDFLRIPEVTNHLLREQIGAPLSRLLLFLRNQISVFLILNEGRIAIRFQIQTHSLIHYCFLRWTYSPTQTHFRFPTPIRSRFPKWIHSLIQTHSR